ncbi:MAG: aminotransferase class V-fold PLP-dependent enzyme [Phycisphaerales bacterium]|nr:aminotransferase class V-fold PLP-dependent enzyme [Phycisphaerales bacterium]
MHTPSRTLPSPSMLSAHWAHDPGVCFLNHGSFGSTPRAILALQRELQDRAESEPVRWFMEELEPRLDAARVAMAAFVGCDAEDFAFVPNATTGVNTVLNAIGLRAGDEVVVTNHEYNACVNACVVMCQRAGAKVVSVDVPFPAAGDDQMEAAILAAVTGRTRLVLLSHITSPTGLILPVKRIVDALNARGVDTLVDGAHAPAFVDLDVRSIGCAYYTGNFHKWLCAPKGSAFLFVRRDRQEGGGGGFNPLVVSHGYNSTRTDRSRFRLQFDYAGTTDMTAYLATPACAELLASMVPEKTIAGVIKRNGELCRRAGQHLRDALGVKPAAPDAMLGALCAIPLPAHPKDIQDRLNQRPTKYADALQDQLIARYGIQVPVFRAPGMNGPDGQPLRILRIATMLYNSIEQYEYLGRAVVEELERERSA